MSAIAKIYANLIKMKCKTIDDVPEWIRDEVASILNDDGSGRQENDGLQSVRTEDPFSL